MRIEFEGAIYHVLARGNRREIILVDEGDKVKFVGLLQESCLRYAVTLHGYVLMGNHFHLLAQTQKANLSRWMHWLLVSYTSYFNWRHEVSGHLFQGRFRALLVEAGEYLLEASRYLHLNPVRGKRLGAGAPAERRARLRQYAWSSYGAYAGLRKRPPWLEINLVLGELSSVETGRAQQLRYRRFVEEGLLREVEDPFLAAQWQLALGSEPFLQRIRDMAARIRERMQQPEGAKEFKGLMKSSCSERPEEILKRVARENRITEEELCAGRRRGFEAQNLAMREIWDRCGLSLREVL